MVDPHEPPSKTSFDATMGDLIAAGIYGDPVRDNFEAVPSPLRHRNPASFDPRRFSPKQRFFVVLWFTAIFVISAVASPYILN